MVLTLPNPLRRARRLCISRLVGADYGRLGKGTARPSGTSRLDSRRGGSTRQATTLMQNHCTQSFGGEAVKDYLTQFLTTRWRKMWALLKVGTDKTDKSRTRSR